MDPIREIWKEAEMPDEASLMRYLQGTASAAERQAIEHSMLDSSFLNEAIEGLQHLDDTAKMKGLTEQLNQQLHKLTTKRGKRKIRRRLQDQSMLIIAILGILFLAVCGFLLIHFSIIKHG
ncbi:MAG TPA: hypothetical protein VG842_09845 [Sediminibacterium sp.]|nr:hypothetical protein [Sediminibacterium sp.]